MEQFVFFCVKDSVAAVKMESSWEGVLEDADGVAFASCEDVFEGGPSFGPGDGGGVGYASCPDCVFACHSARKLSKPLMLGRSHWYVIGCGDCGVLFSTCSSISAELAIYNLGQGGLS